MAMRWLAATTFVIVLFAAQAGWAQAWVAKMFPEKEHDFGTVALGSDTVHRFPVKNIYKQDIELVGVTTSCGCTDPSIENNLLKTGDIGYIVARFNTRGGFKGVHSATLTVNVKWNDKGVLRRGETQLRVHGNIRGDLVFKPGAVSFDAVDQGKASETQVLVTYAGRRDWKIVDVRGESDDLEVELTQKQRAAGRVAYELLVRLKDSAPAGQFNEQLVLVTNDNQNPRIPIYVTGRIVPEIAVSPQPLLLGDVAFGQQVSKKIVVRGKKPFRIVSVECDEDSFQFKTDDKTSNMHVVEIVFNARKDVGNVKQLIHIATDLGKNFDATVTAYATVLPDKPEATANDPGASSDRTDGSTAGAASDPPGRVAVQ